MAEFVGRHRAPEDDAAADIRPDGALHVRAAAVATLDAVQRQVAARRRAIRALGADAASRSWLGLGHATDDQRRTSTSEAVLVRAARTAALETVSALGQRSLVEFVR